MAEKFWCVSRARGRRFKSCTAHQVPESLENSEFFEGQNDKTVKSEKFKSRGLDWDTIVNWFMNSRKAMGCSPKTLLHYQTVFSIFLKWHQEHAPMCSPTECDHVETFLAQQSCRAISKHTYWRALRTLFYFMMQQGLREDNPCLSIKIKIEELLPRTVSAEHVAEVLKHLNFETFTGLRDAVLITLAFDTGARLSELLSFTIGDVLVGQRKVLVRGKGGKERWVFFGRFTAQLLQRYLVEYGKLFGIRPDAPLFVSVFRTPIKSKDTVVKLIWARAQKRAKLPLLPFHGLRHGFAKEWLKAGGDLFSLQQILGHSDLNVTRRYVKLLTEDLERMHQQYSPADKLWSYVGAKFVLRMRPSNKQSDE